MKNYLKIISITYIYIMSDGLSTETHDDCLDITEPFVYDESIQSLQYFEFTPQTFANCNTVGHPIKIYINAQDVYTLPSKSYINIEGQLRRNDNDNPYAAADEVTLINNALMYLFTEIKYDLDSTNIEKLSSPGQISSLFGYLSQPDDFSTSAGLKYCWNKDTTTHARSAEFAASAGAPPSAIHQQELPNIMQNLLLEKVYSPVQIQSDICNVMYVL